MNAKHTKWVVGTCMALCLLLGGCMSETERVASPEGSLEPPVDPVPAYCLAQTDDDAQIKAYMGDLLYTDRYGQAVPDALKRQYEWTDIGSPVIIAKSKSGDGIIYMPLLTRGRQVATGSLYLRDGWISFRGIREGDAEADALFDVNEERMEKRLQREGWHLRTLSFLLDPALFGVEHSADLPLCDVRTTEGDRVFYLYRDDAFQSPSEFARQARRADAGAPP